MSTANRASSCLQITLGIISINITPQDDKLHRDSWVKRMGDAQIERDAAATLKGIIECVPEPDPKMENLPKSFCECNRDHQLYWYPAICDALQQLAATVIL